MFQELDAVLNHGVPKHDHVFGHVFQQGQETSLDVKPRVCAELKSHQSLQSATFSPDTALSVYIRRILTGFSEFLHDECK